MIDTNGTLEECYSLCLALANPGFKIKAVVCSGGKISVEKAGENVSRIAGYIKKNIDIY